MESYRTERGPRQRVVAYLGDVAEQKRVGVKRAAKGIKGSWQSRLFLLGIPVDKVNDDRLYRALDKLLPHKTEIEKHLKERR